MLSGQLSLLLVGCLALFALLLALWQLQGVRKLRREVSELRNQVVSNPTPDSKSPVNFSTSLDAVERQQLQETQATPPRNSAEKYRYIGSLSAQGLDAKGIAEALQLPIAEVEQLLRLAKLRPAASAK